MKTSFYAILAMLAVLTLPVASAMEAVAKHRDWSVYSTRIDGSKACIAATRATDMAPKSTSHGDVVYYVTYWSGKGNRPQTSMKVGFNFRKDKTPTFRVNNGRGGRIYSGKLFSADNEIFARDEEERSIVNALRKGSELRIEAVSERDTYVTYHFSLSGSSSAIDEARKACA